MQQEFELKITDANGAKQIATWLGTDGIDAAQRYANSHPGVTVRAWRYPRYEIKIGMVPLAN